MAYCDVHNWREMIDCPECRKAKSDELRRNTTYDGLEVTRHDKPKTSGEKIRDEFKRRFDEAYPADGELRDEPARMCFYGLGEKCRCVLPEGHEGEHVMRVEWLTGVSNFRDLAKAEEIRRDNTNHPAWERMQEIKKSWQDCPAMSTYCTGTSCRNGCTLKARRCTCHPADAAEFDDGCQGGYAFDECCRIANAKRGSVEILPDPEFNLREIKSLAWLAWFTGLFAGFLLGLALGTWILT